MHELSYYSPDYLTARQKFRKLAQQKGGTLLALPVNERRGLYIDVALWQSTSDTLLLHTSGLHGVEAFPGSAVQCAFLDSWEPDQLKGNSLVLIHCINPFGMQYLRRWNADNVDLNRNFLFQFNSLPPNPAYHNISSFLNPSTVLKLSAFNLKALRLLTRHRFSKLQQAVAQGQYTEPAGIFYGGNQQTIEGACLLQFFQEQCAHYQHIRGIDFHTGLGTYGRSSFYLEADFSEEDCQRMEVLLDAPMIHVQPGKKQSYQTQGGFIAFLKQLMASSDMLMATQEIGTVGPIKILKALREENFAYHYALDQQPQAGEAVKRAFSPENDRWKTQAVQDGVRALFRLIHASRRWE
uniref:DUF2817 domain-containing protein n=1 Tax=Roseihalotalea indica TaxID=2867963 RepID=A0AA49GSY8_9BACT|nr:DUF2817 domain-containing protein [Tunicatimonas sp. TK19036]